MPSLSPLLLRVVHKARDLPAALEQCSKGLRAQLESGKGKGIDAKAFELAQMFEHCHPNLEHAIAAYIVCWKANRDRMDALSRARYLSLQCGDFSTAAKLAGLQYRQTQDIALKGVEGFAWLDAGEPDRAIMPFLAAVTGKADDARMHYGLATAQREWPNIRDEVKRVQTLAENTNEPRARAELYLQLTRLYRLLHTEPEREEDALLSCLESYGEGQLAPDPHAQGLVSARLAHLADDSRLMGALELELNRCATPTNIVAQMRYIVLLLHPHERFRATSIRLIKNALTLAYDAKLSVIPGHVGMLVLYRDHCVAGKLNSDILTLVDQGLQLQLPELDLLFLSLSGLLVAWKGIEDMTLARTYAKITAEAAPDNPLVVEAKAAGLLTSSDGAGTMEANEGIFLEDLPPAEPAQGELTLMEDDGHSIAFPPSVAPASKAVSHTALQALEHAADERQRERDERTPDRAVRLRITLQATFEYNGEALNVSTRDVSVGGCFLLTELSLDTGAQLDITLFVPSSYASLQTTPMEVRARVVRHLQGSGYGLEFVDPSTSLTEQIQLLLDGQSRHA